MLKVWILERIKLAQIQIYEHQSIDSSKVSLCPNSCIKNAQALKMHQLSILDTLPSHVLLKCTSLICEFFGEHTLAGAFLTVLIKKK